ncbi:MAG: HAMP domain-containing histidine kinase [Alphaproteobacteria bacterium]|nr:HAMP domain-containing histidine kinase [Alphaproteobacteria bacterium]
MNRKTFRLPPAIKSLSARLLVLTIFFVMLSELFIYAPSVARYRKVYLEERVADAHLATLTLEATPDHMLGPELEAEVLRQAKARQIALSQPGEPKRILMMSGAPKPDLSIDLGQQSFMSFLMDGFETLFQSGNRVLMVTGSSPHDASTTIEVLIDETPMRLEMYDYSERILQLSVIISLFTASLVYLSLQLLMVYPMRRMTESIVRFRDDPENPNTTVEPTRRADEIGVVVGVLADMQSSIRRSLKERARLAALGSAVARINHDLRNILSPAQLLSDRLVGSEDPEVKRIAPRLVSAIDRAVDLSVQTLNFATDSGPQLDRTRFQLRPLADEVGGAFEAADGDQALQWRNNIDAGLEAVADRDQIYRVLANLAHNAREAGATCVTFDADVDDAELRLEVGDNGPGLSDQAKKNLFQPFSGSTRPGGTGLGLAISDELVRAHGGELQLVSSGPDGARFRIILPRS